MCPHQLTSPSKFMTMLNSSLYGLSAPAPFSLKRAREETVEAPRGTLTNKRAQTNNMSAATQTPRAFDSNHLVVSTPHFREGSLSTDEFHDAPEELFPSQAQALATAIPVSGQANIQHQSPVSITESSNDSWAQTNTPVTVAQPSETNKNLELVQNEGSDQSVVGDDFSVFGSWVSQKQPVDDPLPVPSSAYTSRVDGVFMDSANLFGHDDDTIRYVFDMREHTPGCSSQFGTQREETPPLPVIDLEEESPPVSAKEVEVHTTPQETHQDPYKTISQELYKFERFHNRVVALASNIPMRHGFEWPCSQFWIAVMLPGKVFKRVRSEKEFIWMKGHRLTTVSTIWHGFQKSTMADPRDLVLLLGCERVQFTDRVQELNYFNDNFIVFCAVTKETAARVAKGLVDDFVPEVIEINED